MKIELTVSPKYVKGWGVWEGIREVIQNYLDSRDKGYPGYVKRTEGNTLVIRNNGVVISRADICILGEGDKAGNEELRGENGEGLALGALALTREGYKVTIRTGDRAYTASFEPSAKFNDTSVLVLRDRKIDYVDAVEVKVSSITASQWEIMSQRFIDLRQHGAGNHYECSRVGKVLFDDCDRGKIFSKGIFVEERGDICFGYDFYTAKLDRDRKKVSSWDFSYHSAQILASAANAEKMTVEAFLDMLNAGAAEVQHAHFHVDNELADKIEESFVNKHGEKAVPVSSENEVEMGGTFGLAGVITSSTLVRIFNDKGKGLNSKVEEVKQSVQHVWGDYTLSENEYENRECIFALLLTAGVPIDPARIQVVKFFDETLCGSYVESEDDSSQYVISIAKRILDDKRLLLETLINEFAKREGPEGLVTHTNELHSIYSKIISHAMDWDKIVTCT